MKNLDPMEGLWRNDRKCMREMSKVVPRANAGMGDVVQCCVCQRGHSIKQETFIVFYGNVTIGLLGGVIGHNFNAEGQLDRAMVCCRTAACRDELMPLTD